MDRHILAQHLVVARDARATAEITNRSVGRGDGERREIKRIAQERRRDQRVLGRPRVIGDGDGQARFVVRSFDARGQHDRSRCALAVQRKHLHERSGELCAIALEKRIVRNRLKERVFR